MALKLPRWSGEFAELCAPNPSSRDRPQWCGTDDAAGLEHLYLLLDAQASQCSVTLAAPGI